MQPIRKLNLPGPLVWFFVLAAPIACCSAQDNVSEIAFAAFDEAVLSMQAAHRKLENTRLAFRRSSIVESRSLARLEKSFTCLYESHGAGLRLYQLAPLSDTKEKIWRLHASNQLYSFKIESGTPNFKWQLVDVGEPFQEIVEFDSATKISQVQPSQCDFADSALHPSTAFWACSIPVEWLLSIKLREFVTIENVERLESGVRVAAIVALPENLRGPLGMQASKEWVKEFDIEFSSEFGGLPVRMSCNGVSGAGNQATKFDQLVTWEYGAENGFWLVKMMRDERIFPDIKGIIEIDGIEVVRGDKARLYLSHYGLPEPVRPFAWGPVAMAIGAIGGLFAIFAARRLKLRQDKGVRKAL